MNCLFQRAFILLDYVYVIRKSQVVYPYSVYRYSFKTVTTTMPIAKNNFFAFLSRDIFGLKANAITIHSQACWINIVDLPASAADWLVYLGESV